MKKIILRGSWLLTIFALLFLTGCAKNLMMTTQTMNPVSADSTSDSSKDQQVDLLLEPYECVGLKLTPAIKKGEVSIYRGIVSDVILGEYYPGRIRWNGIVVQENGKEFFAQFLFSSPDWSGNFLWTIIVDGYPESTAKIVQISTLVEFVYDAFGYECPISNRDDFLKNESFRKEFVLNNGTKLSELQSVDKNTFYREVLLQWNAWGTDKGKILSPLGLEEVQAIAAINPQYGFGQKLIADGRFSLSLDPIATSVSMGIDIFRSSSGAVPSTGWDYNSEFPNRRNMGLIFEYIGQMRKKLIQDINANNARFVGQGR